MARKAGQVRLGEEAASQAVLDHKARLILIAADAGETTARRLKRLESDKLPVLTLPEKKSELGAAVGFVDVAAAAVCDLGFACAIAQKLAAEDEGCRDAAERLKATSSFTTEAGRSTTSPAAIRSATWASNTWIGACSVLVCSFLGMVCSLIWSNDRFL